MFVALAVLLIALGGFTALVTRRIRPDSQPALDVEQLRGFCYVGAIGAGVLGVVVVIVGLLTRDGRLADGIALLGFFGYLVYSLAAWAILTWPADRWPRRASRPPR